MDSTATELLFRTLCDTAPEKGTNATYLYGQTRCNEEAVFQTAVELDPSRLLILRTAGRSGYAGFDAWYDALELAGIDPARIEGVEMDNGILLNTRTESQALVRHAMKHCYQSITVIAPPFHQFRAFMTAITIALEEYPKLAIYSQPAMATPWHKEVSHSQGKLTATRSQLIHEELARIETYQNKGDLAPFEQVLDYLNKRG